MTQQQRELAKYREARPERNEIFETLILAGVTKEQLLAAGEAFNLMAQGDADKMMDLWREIRDRTLE